ncbi:PHB depolymerase family esterase [Ideonella sp.]|uniref:extracellular catalytic domain type 2 short-chain-length polyhydroxyalkanoate depolymerase n=1 Tax=Ideonella sp. TaxID=1929293 RepID=UPI002B46BEB7|nr:PHB depolymerase family esterase [Ideonella sp.]HJV70683.1 PHB depolymerase family esterase [Ideonella sp.]
MKTPAVKAGGVAALFVAAFATFATPTVLAAVVALPALNIDKSQVTVSGLSSGGFMANQLGYAYASTFKGVGVFAGGPYMCAGHSNYTACMYNASITSAMLNTMQADLNNWSGTANDALANVASQKVFMFVGTSDYTVGPIPMNAVQTQYTNNGVSAANLSYVQRSGTAHVFPTDFDATGNNACSSSTSPYISNCGYDGAKAALTKFYGTLNARNNAPAAANYIEFDQTPFTAGNPGMAASGWAYVPSNCAGGASCRLHVALHGCQQNAATIGDKFVKNTGYSRWADTNNIVVLFPQTKVDNTSRQTSASGSLANPNGCWDWIGWYGSNFAQKAGTQMAALKAMVDQVSSGSGGGGGSLPAPTGVATSNATDTTMTIAWGAVSGAAGYNVFRGGAQVNASLVGGTSYVDSGLSPATTYSWTVAAVDSAGAQGAVSSAASGTTTGAAPVCYTASNYAHTTAGRAHQSGGYALANGSNQNMGLWNVFVTTTLKQTGPNYYVIGTCS